MPLAATPSDPGDSREYALRRFLDAPGASRPAEWLDDQGRGAPRERAVEVRLTKPVGRGLLTVRLDIDRALGLGLIRGAP